MHKNEMIKRTATFTTSFTVIEISSGSLAIYIYIYIYKYVYIIYVYIYVYIVITIHSWINGCTPLPLSLSLTRAHALFLSLYLSFTLSLSQRASHIYSCTCMRVPYLPLPTLARVPVRCVCTQNPSMCVSFRVSLNAKRQISKRPRAFYPRLAFPRVTRRNPVETDDGWTPMCCSFSDKSSERGRTGDFYTASLAAALTLSPISSERNFRPVFFSPLPPAVPPGGPPRVRSFVCRSEIR